LGEHSVKNIAEPVRVYRFFLESEAAGKVIGEKRSKPSHRRWAAIGGVLVSIRLAGVFAIWNFYFRPAFEPASVEKMAFPLLSMVFLLRNQHEKAMIEAQKAIELSPNSAEDHFFLG
jgi:hypothetical protein